MGCPHSPLWAKHSSSSTLVVKTVRRLGVWCSPGGGARCAGPSGKDATRSVVDVRLCVCHCCFSVAAMTCPGACGGCGNCMGTFCCTLVCGECFGCEICVCRSALMESNKYGCVWIALLAHRLVLGYVLEARYVVCIRMFLLCTVGLCALI